MITDWAWAGSVAEGEVWEFAVPAPPAEAGWHGEWTIPAALQGSVALRPDGLGFSIRPPEGTRGLHELACRLSGGASAQEMACQVTIRVTPALRQGAGAPGQPVPPSPSQAAAPEPVEPEPGPVTPVRIVEGFAPIALDKGMYVLVASAQGGAPSLEVPLHLGATLVVGRYSASEGLPGLDVSGLVADRERLKQISRRQAEVFWSRGGVCLVNRGKNLIGYRDSRLAPGDAVSVEPGWDISLPAGVTLRLERRE